MKKLVIILLTPFILYAPRKFKKNNAQTFTLQEFHNEKLQRSFSFLPTCAHDKSSLPLIPRKKILKENKQGLPIVIKKEYTFPLEKEQKVKESVKFLCAKNLKISAQLPYPLLFGSFKSLPIKALNK